MSEQPLLALLLVAAGYFGQADPRDGFFLLGGYGVVNLALMIIRAASG